MAKSINSADSVNLLNYHKYKKDAACNNIKNIGSTDTFVSQKSESEEEPKSKFPQVSNEQGLWVRIRNGIKNAIGILISVLAAAVVIGGAGEISQTRSNTKTVSVDIPGNAVQNDITEPKTEVQPVSKKNDIMESKADTKITTKPTTADGSADTNSTNPVSASTESEKDTFKIIDSDSDIDVDTLKINDIDTVKTDGINTVKTAAADTQRTFSKDFENGIKAQQAQSVSLEDSNIYEAVKNEVESGVKIGYLEWYNLGKDEYGRVRQTGEYAVDYGEAGISSNETAFIFALEPDEENEFGFGYNKYYVNGETVIARTREWAPYWICHEERGGNCVERVSLNVKPEADLIRELDIFMETGIYTDADGNICQVGDVSQFEYKTPSSIYLWNKRQDPITIYFAEEVNTETYKAISDITKRYARGTVNNANTDSPWVSNVETYPTEEMCRSLIIDLGNYSIDAAEAFRLTCEQRHYNISTGQYEAYKNILECYSLLAPPLPPAEKTPDMSEYSADVA